MKRRSYNGAIRDSVLINQIDNEPGKSHSAQRSADERWNVSKMKQEGESLGTSSSPLSRKSMGRKYPFSRQVKLLREGNSETMEKTLDCSLNSKNSELADSDLSCIRPTASTPEIMKSLPVMDTIKRAFRSKMDVRSPTDKHNSTAMKVLLRKCELSCSNLSNENSRSVIEDSLSIRSTSRLGNSSIDESKEICQSGENGVAKQDFKVHGRASFSSQSTSECDKIDSVNSSKLLVTTPLLNESHKKMSFESGKRDSIGNEEWSEDQKADDSTREDEREFALQGVVAFVDVRSSHDNRSEGVARVLENLGAVVPRKLTPEITHVVFLNGRKSTLNFAEKINAYLVSVLWVDSCLKNQRRGDEDLYPASRNDVASPTAINRNKLNRLKSMQPKSFEEEMKKSGKLEERRRRRNVVKEKKDDQRFEIISLEDIEMKDISKKIQRHNSFVNSPIAESSPFLDQVMRRLSAKRASLNGSPECARLAKSNSRKEMKKREPLENGSNSILNDDVFRRSPNTLFEQDVKAVGAKDPAVTLEGLQLERTAKDGVEKDSDIATNSLNEYVKAAKANINFYSGKRLSMNIAEDCNRGANNICMGSTDSGKKVINEENDQTTSDLRSSEKESHEEIDGKIKEFMKRTTEKKQIEMKSSTSEIENHQRNYGEIKEIAERKSRKKKLLPKNQALQSYSVLENEITANTPAEKEQDDAKDEIKAKQKRKRLPENSPRKRVKRDKDDKGGKLKELIKVLKNHEIESDEEESENEHQEMKESSSENESKRIKRKGGEPAQVTSASKKLMSKGSLVMTSMHFGQQEFVRKVVKKLGSFSIAKSVNSTTTHVVAGNQRRTLNILNAVVQGCWILSPNWISDSCDKGKWLNEEDFALDESFPSAKINRFSKLQAGISLSSSLFKGHNPFFISENSVPPRSELLKLIRKCGGQVTSNSKKAQICIGDKKAREADCKFVHEKWVLDCIMEAELLDIESYIIGPENPPLVH